MSALHEHQSYQTPRKLFMLYRTENNFFTTFSNFKHDYIKKFYWSSHIFHWSSHFFISQGPRTDKFRGVCHIMMCWIGNKSLSNVRGLSFLSFTMSISWLLMPWLLTSPGYQQPWYWLCRIARPQSYLRKDFNYLIHINVEEWHKM